MIVFQYSETACLQGFKQKGVTYREPPLIVIGLSNCLKGLSEWHNGEAYHLEMLQAEWNADDGHAIEKAYHEIY